MPRSEEKRVLSHAARVNLMKNIRGQARRGQEGLEAREREREKREEERTEKGERKREGEGGRERKKPAKDASRGERSLSGRRERASLLSLSSRLSKDVSSLLFSLFFSFLSLAFAPRRV